MKLQCTISINTYSCVGDAVSPSIKFPAFLLAPALKIQFSARSDGEKPQIDISILHRYIQKYDIPQSVISVRYCTGK